MLGYVLEEPRASAHVFIKRSVHRVERLIQAHGRGVLELQSRELSVAVCVARGRHCVADITERGELGGGQVTCPSSLARYMLEGALDESTHAIRRGLDPDALVGQPAAADLNVAQIVQLAEEAHAKVREPCRTGHTARLVWV